MEESEGRATKQGGRRGEAVTPQMSQSAADLGRGAGPVLDLSCYVPALLVILADRLTSGASTLYRRHFGIGTTEWRIMVHLAIEPWCTPQAIGRWIGLDKAAISRSIRVLERRSLAVLRPHPTDNRSYVLALTAPGRQLHDRIIRVAFEREARLLSCLSVDERQQLIDMLNRMQHCLPVVNGPIEIPGGSPREAVTQRG
jgi:DNA-binding MarR family transcriptional regulator